MADQWEYQVLDVDWDKSHGAWKVSDMTGAMEFISPTMVEVFNRMGEANWEMAAVTSFTGELIAGEFAGSHSGNWEAPNYRAVFKRRKQ